MTSLHYKNNRNKRENFIEEYLGGDGVIVDGFVIDRNHKNGLEVHSITDKGVIVIHNFYSGKLITKLLARRNQIERYYKRSGRKPPPEYKDILKIAEMHEQLGYNNL